MGYADHTTLQKMETGKIQYTQEILEKAAIIYKCSVMELLFVHPDRSGDVAALIRAAGIMDSWKTVPQDEPVRKKKRR